MVAMCGSFSSFIIPSQRLRQACQNQSLERVTQNASHWDLNSWELPYWRLRLLSSPALWLVFCSPIMDTHRPYGQPDDLARPGHVFPLHARPGGGCSNAVVKPKAP